MAIRISRRCGRALSELSCRAMTIGEYRRLVSEAKKQGRDLAAAMHYFGLGCGEFPFAVYDYYTDYFDQQWDLFFVEPIHDY